MFEADKASDTGYLEKKYDKISIVMRKLFLRSDRIHAIHK